MSTLATFAANNSYAIRFIGDSNLVVELKVVRRTAKTLWAIVRGEEKRMKIYTDHNGEEYVRPYGTYSMNPTAHAKRVLSPEAQEEAVPAVVPSKPKDELVTIKVDANHYEIIVSVGAQGLPCKTTATYKGYVLSFTQAAYAEFVEWFEEVNFKYEILSGSPAEQPETFTDEVQPREIDDAEAATILANGGKVTVVSDEYYPEGLPAKWVNPNNHTCTAFTDAQSSTFFYSEDVRYYAGTEPETKEQYEERKRLAALVTEEVTKDLSKQFAGLPPSPTRTEVDKVLKEIDEAWQATLDENAALKRGISTLIEDYQRRAATCDDMLENHYPEETQGFARISGKRSAYNSFVAELQRFLTTGNV